MSRSKKILDAALSVDREQNDDNDINVNLRENKRHLADHTNTTYNKQTNFTYPDVDDLITLSDIEGSCDDSVVDPNFNPDIISGTDSSDDEVSNILLKRSLLSAKRSFSAQESHFSCNESTTHNCEPSTSANHYETTNNSHNHETTDPLMHKTIAFIAVYPGPIIIAETFNPDIDYQADLHFNTSAIQRNAPINDIHDTRANKQKIKHPLVTTPCKCSRDCTLFTLQERRGLWSSYWDLKPKSRRIFLNKCVTITGVKRRKTSQGSNEYLRNESRFYALPKKVDGNKIYAPVCRQFLLNTLGYTNDSVITELCKALKRGDNLVVEANRRGRKPLERGPIEDHILSYNPVQSHYRRHNAPITRYLPRHLTIKDMFTDFNTKYPNAQYGIETYRKTLKNLKVSLCMPKSDMCVDCQTYKDNLANYADESLIPDDIKKTYNDHKTKAESASQEYKMETQYSNSNHIKYYSMDLQKVILLPEMPQIKESHFVSRLITFNLTFAPIQQKSRDPAVCVLWHEAIAGREAHNIIDAIWAFIDSQRDTRHLHLWADNCTAQNKNWYLYTALVVMLNSPQNDIEAITISYLTKGHTHMSADSVHGNIDRKMTRKQSIHDFEDFKSIVLQARSNIKVVEPNRQHNWPKKKRSPRATRDPLKDFQLTSVVQVKFVRGLRHLMYKTSFSDAFSPLDFLIKKFDVTVWPTMKNELRGIKTSKKEEILTKLVHLMPESRRRFWHELPVNDSSIDLVEENSD